MPVNENLYRELNSASDFTRTSLVAQMVKHLLTLWGRPGFNPWDGKISWKRKWQPTPVFLPGKSHGWRSLVGYSPWCRRVGHDWATSLSLLISKTFSQIRKSVPKCNANYISKFHIFLRHSAFIKKQILYNKLYTV